MNKLLSTTALVIALGVPVMAFSQTASSGSQSATQQPNGMASSFMTARSQSDIFASELIGHDVYARRVAAQDTRSEDNSSDMTGDETAISDADARADDTAERVTADGGQGLSGMNPSELDEMEQIGQINEIILTNDGEVRAIVIGVGGFLGMGAQDIAVTMDQVTFAADREDASQIYVMVNIGTDTLSDAPAYDRSAAMRGEAKAKPQERSDDMAAAAGTGMSQEQGNLTGFAAPQMEREGFSRVDAKDISTEMLIDKTVFDTQENDVGSIVDMLLDDDGTVSHIIIDFGGFLGIGSSQASVGFDELTILSTEDYSDVRVYVDASKEQIQGLPRYTARN